MTDLFNIIANVGFPITVTVYLLTRFDSKIELLTKSIYDLNRSITELKTDRRF